MDNVDTDPTWFLQDATFEKMGQMMSEKFKMVEGC